MIQRHRRYRTDYVTLSSHLQQPEVGLPLVPDHLPAGEAADWDDHPDCQSQLTNQFYTQLEDRNNGTANSEKISRYNNAENTQPRGMVHPNQNLWYFVLAQQF